MKYRTLVVDPPWKYEQRWGRKDEWSPTGRMKKRGVDRGAATQYETQDIDVIAAIPVGEWAEDDAHMYLWVTNAFMEFAFPLARGWGFEPKTILTWVKPQIGMGHYFRNSTEHVLFCVRGSLPTARNDEPTYFVAPRAQHSAKPQSFYDMVETMSPGPYLDVFNRRQRFGWDAWGFEAYTPDGLPEPTKVHTEKRDTPAVQVRL